MDLGLRVPQLVDALAQRREARTGPVQMAGEILEVAVRRVFERGDALEEDLQRVDVARVGEVQVTLPLGETLDDRVELLVLLRLVLAVGVDGQPERVLPGYPSRGS